MTPGYRDNFGVWHDHAQEDFCTFHPMDIFCMGQQQHTVAITEVPKKHDEGAAHGIIHIIGDNIGWSPLLLIILLGSKKIRMKLYNVGKALIK